MELKYFESLKLYDAATAFFKHELKLPYQAGAETLIQKETFFNKGHKQEEELKAIYKEGYFFGLLNNEALGLPQKESNEGILILAVELKTRENGALPKRSSLAKMLRVLSQNFNKGTAVVVLFKYQDLKGNTYIALANAERIDYKLQHKEGKRIGKVSLLRDVKVDGTHAGHIRILQELKSQNWAKKSFSSYQDVYEQWLQTFSVNLLNKKFYEELFNWYLWAIKEVKFPSGPIAEDRLKGKELEALQQEHQATHVIRMLTRLLFVWFIKEKKLIPEELFDLNYLEKELLKDVNTSYGGEGLFAQSRTESIYYRAILQNLFFATLNCPIKSTTLDPRSRGFRKAKSHRGVNYLMRYEDYFQNPALFLQLVNEKVPFLNGGLFECLDQKDQHNRERDTYIDGFTENEHGKKQLLVPDFLFFGSETAIDLSQAYGSKSKKYKQQKVKGLIHILNSYKFTITENTPLEEEVALDPELLGKVFENLLASYNPETQTTARKQTGSFYTPREIVNYMVDQSLLAYLKNNITLDDIGLAPDELALYLQELRAENHELKRQNELEKEIVKALGQCQILDPACGSGAYPMGILQRMVELLRLLDPNNEAWKQTQIQRTQAQTSEVFKTEDKEERANLLAEINEAFDQNLNDPDYARKLYLIENCIYGVDIQPIASQITKLRFFISLVIEQKVDRAKENFGIRPLPNLETKFVAANTLLSLPKMQNGQTTVFQSQDLDELEEELKFVRSKIFNARSQKTKRKYRQKDAALRQAIANKLEALGWPNETAQKLADWDPYDQKKVASFFDQAWMFDVKQGFDIVIGNPPYVQLQQNAGELAKLYKSQNFKSFNRSGDIYMLFYEKSLEQLKRGGISCFITSNKWMRAKYGKALRELFLKYNPILLIDLGPDIFESATVDTNILLIANDKNKANFLALSIQDKNVDKIYQKDSFSRFEPKGSEMWVILSKEQQSIKNRIEAKGKALKNWDVTINRGILTGYNEAFVISQEQRDALIQEDPKSAEVLKPILRGRDIGRYSLNFSDLWLVATHNGYGSQPRVNVEKDYPAVYKHLLGYKKKAEKRTDKGEHWTNLRSCAYQEQFEQPKLIYQEMVQHSCFYYDESDHFYCNDTGRIISGERLKYLTGILNSRLFFYAVKHFYGGGGLGNHGVRMKHTFFEVFPVIEPSKKEEDLLSFLTEVIQLGEKKSVNTAKMQTYANAFVFNLYFAEHMEERGIDVIKDIEQAVNAQLAGRIWEQLSEEEQMVIVHHLAAAWESDKALEEKIASFSEKSPEYLAPILKNYN